jgi:hypothetical protein
MGEKKNKQKMASKQEDTHFQNAFSAELEGP